MKRLAIMACVGALAGASLTSAQDVRFSQREDPAPTTIVSPGEVTPTVEMWFYEQALRRYNDPQVAVRAKAEFRARQRDQRLAAQAWYGYSNMRPTVTFTPNMTPYSPGWTGNSYMPGQWRGAGSPVYVVPRGTGNLRGWW